MRCSVGLLSCVFWVVLFAAVFQPSVERKTPAAHQGKRQHDERSPEDIHGFMTDAQPLLDCFTVHISVYVARCKPENASRSRRLSGDWVPCEEDQPSAEFTHAGSPQLLCHASQRP